MSKIVCDVCGTSYLSTQTQCPICGCVRPADTVSVETQSSSAGRPSRENYVYIKGGRFSKTNVQKRNQGKPMVPAKNQKTNVTQDNPKSDKGLAIAVCLLLVAIVAVVIYIAVHFFASPNDNTNNTIGAGATAETNRPTAGSNLDAPNDGVDENASQDNANDNDDPGSTDDENADVPESEVVSCTGLTLSSNEVKFSGKDQKYQLEVTLSPANTTDKLVFKSSNPAIATVTDDGNIVSVSSGETDIEVICGEMTAVCRIICTFYKAPYKINKTDVTLQVGKDFDLILKDANGKIVPVEWKVEHPNVCSVNGNKVTGVKPSDGYTTVYAEYDGETYICKVLIV